MLVDSVNVLFLSGRVSVYTMQPQSNSVAGLRCRVARDLKMSPDEFTLLDNDNGSAAIRDNDFITSPTVQAVVVQVLRPRRHNLPLRSI